jgi:hypothetical protein
VIYAIEWSAKRPNEKNQQAQEKGQDLRGRTKVFLRPFMIENPDGGNKVVGFCDGRMFEFGESNGLPTLKSMNSGTERDQ